MKSIQPNTEYIYRIKNSRIAKSVPETRVSFPNGEGVWPAHELLLSGFLDVAVGELEVANIGSVP